MDKQYLLVVNGKPDGPYTIDELRAIGIKAGDFVKTPDMADYKEAHELAQLRTIFGFTPQSVMPQYFGAFDQRVLAAVIDWLIVGGALVLITYIPALIINNPAVRAIVGGALLLAIPLAYLIYHIVMEGSVAQATYGKKILKIQVCNIDGSVIGYRKAAKRNVAKICSVLTLLIGYIMCFFNKKQQCLHDVIAGTLVMRSRLL